MKLAFYTARRNKLKDSFLEISKVLNNTLIYGLRFIRYIAKKYRIANKKKLSSCHKNTEYNICDLITLRTFLL